jgi:hypothetical protein
MLPPVVTSEGRAGDRVSDLVCPLSLAAAAAAMLVAWGARP